MNARLHAAFEVLPVLIPTTALMVASFADIEWLRTAGLWGLGTVVAIYILRGRLQRHREAVSPWSIGLALLVVVFLFLAPFLPHASLGFMVVPLLVGCLAALFVVIGHVLYGLLRLSDA